MGINRRKFLKSVGLGTIMLGAQPLTALASEALVSDSSSQDRKDITDDGPQVQIGDHIAIADTEYGKVKGYIMRGIYTFLGIPYAADTSGKNRFMPPCKHKPWTGVRPAVFYGNTAPQDVYSRASTSYDMFVDHWNYDEISENCLCLNIWTQGIADGKKRPVVVWLHGGGFTRGNGIEQDGYNGENITRYGDIVYCSINHRLGVFGFTDLSAFGEKYKDSGNAGLLARIRLHALGAPEARFGPQELAALAREVGRICRRTLETPQVLSCKGMTTLLFSERPVLRAVFGMAGAAAQGEVSGDAVQQFCSPTAAQMILCDGMGTGRPAAVDGNLAAELTARLLKAGIPAELAARLVNVALALKSEEESGATLDLISVDLYTGTARLFKAGAAPGFLVHGGRARAV